MDGRNERGQIRQEVWLKEEAAVRRKVPKVREEKNRLQQQKESTCQKAMTDVMMYGADTKAARQV